MTTRSAHSRAREARGPGRPTRSLVSRFREEIGVWRRVMADRRTPRAAKLLLGGAVAYVLSPVDLIPDFLPVIGHLDDVLVVSLLVWLALRMIPQEVVRDARAAVPHQAGPSAERAPNAEGAGEA